MLDDREERLQPESSLASDSLLSLLATKGKSQAERTRAVISRFLRRAFRRPVKPDELARSMSLVDRASSEGEKWEAAVHFAMTATLCSPKF